MGICTSTAQPTNVHPLPDSESATPSHRVNPAVSVYRGTSSNSSTLITPLLQRHHVQSSSDTKHTVQPKHDTRHINYTPQTAQERSLYRYFCPICMNYYTEIYSTSCCNHYTCCQCTVAHINQRTAHAKQPYTAIPHTSLNLPCIHCTTQPVQFSRVTYDAPVRHYSESPGTREAWNRAHKLKTLQATNSTLVSINEHSMDKPLINYLSSSQYHATLSPRLSIDTSEGHSEQPDIQIVDVHSPSNAAQAVARLDFETYTDSRRTTDTTAAAQPVSHASDAARDEAAGVPLPNTAIPPPALPHHTFIQHDSTSIVTLEPYNARDSQLMGSAHQHDYLLAGERTRGSQSTSRGLQPTSSDAADPHSTDDSMHADHTRLTGSEIRIVNVDNGRVTYDTIKPMSAHTAGQSVSSHITA